MRKFILAALVVAISGCAAPATPSGRWTIVPVSINGYQGQGSILLDTKTGDSYLQDYWDFSRPDGKKANVLYWQKIPTTRPTTLPTDDGGFPVGPTYNP